MTHHCPSCHSKEVSIVGTLSNGTEILQIPILVMPDELPIRWEDL